MAESITESEAHLSLRRHTNFSLSSTSARRIDEFIEVEATQQREAEYSPETSSQRLLVSAAEFALIDLIPEICQAEKGSWQEWLSAEVEITEGNIWQAQVKSACHNGWYHSKATDTVDSLAAVASVDVSRAQSIARSVGLKPGIEGIVSVAETLEHSHARHPAESFQAVAQSHIIRVQAVLWCAQLTLLDQPGFPGTVDTAIELACRVQGLFERRGLTA